MSLKQNALMIPIHPKKVNWLFALISSIDRTKIDSIDFDIVLLVSNEIEKLQIIRALRVILREWLDVIVFVDVEIYICEVIKDENLLEKYRKNIDRCIVNLKKFLGMHWLAYNSTNYEYVAVIDCDTIFKNSNSALYLFSRLKENYLRKIYFGGRTDRQDINKTLINCSTFFDTLNANKIRSITVDFTVYPWFFEIPFYSKSDLQDFFKYMQNESPISFWNSQNWHSFEHIIFIYYLCLYKNANLIDYSDGLRECVPEALTAKDLMVLKYRYNYIPTWIRLSQTFSEGFDLIEGWSIVMIYHTDRI